MSRWRPKTPGFGANLGPSLTVPFPAAFIEAPDAREPAYRRPAPIADDPPPLLPPIAFHVNPTDELPLYRQIVRQVIGAIAGGKLRPLDQLPSHRELSQALVIAPLTVKKAYDELERDGYIETQRGQGTFVSARAPVIEHDEKLGRIEPMVQRLVSEASLLGIDEDALVRIVRNAARSLRPGRKR